MAPRYWVGGTANWDVTAGTKWATTSGGAGGASVPTTADDVYFDSSSGAVTVTIAPGNTGCKSITCTGFAGTITGTAAITVNGSVTLVAGMTYTYTGMMTFTGTGTLTTAGKTFGPVTVNGSGITLTLGDALTATMQIVDISSGTFNTAGYSLTAGRLASNNSNARSILLGSSTVTLSYSTAVDFTTSENLVFDAGTSQILITTAGGAVFSDSQDFYDLSFIGTSGLLSGSNSFNNLTIASPTTGTASLSIDSNQTVNGTFYCAGNSVTARCSVLSSPIGSSITITAAAISADNCDFRDITLAGAAAGASPVRAGDCGGNSGITFPEPKTVYRVGTNTTWEGSSSWALTSGGTGSDNNFPLPQDTAVINNSTALTGTLSLSSYNIGSLDCSSRTTGITLSHSASAARYGYYKLGSGVTVTGTSTQSFFGRGTMDFNSAGKTITFPVSVNAPNGTFRLGDAFSSSNSITHTRGTFDANNYNLTCTSFASSNSNTRTISMGSGLWTLSGTGTVWNMATTTGLTLNKDTANILLSNTSTTARTFAGGGLSYNKLTIGGATGTSTLTVSGANSLTELASTKTVAHTIAFGANQGTIDTWSITGTSGKVVTVNSSSVGTRRTFTLSNVTSGINYLSVKDIGETSGSKFYVGADSTDGGNNSNVIFTAPPVATASGNMLLLF